MIYDETKGCGLQFTKFDDQFDADNIIYRDTPEEIIKLTDIIICSFNGDSLIEALGQMQANAYTQDEEGNLTMDETFKNKFEIPSYFINLFLEKYNMKVLGW